MNKKLTLCLVVLICSVIFILRVPNTYAENQSKSTNTQSQMNMSDMDMKNMDMSGTDMKDMDMSGSDMKNMDMSKNNMSGHGSDMAGHSANSNTNLIWVICGFLGLIIIIITAALVTKPKKVTAEKGEN